MRPGHACLRDRRPTGRAPAGVRPRKPAARGRDGRVATRPPNDNSEPLTERPHPVGHARLDRTFRPESLPVRVASSRRTAQRGDPFVEHARGRAVAHHRREPDLQWHHLGVIPCPNLATMGLKVDCVPAQLMRLKLACLDSRLCVPPAVAAAAVTVYAAASSVASSDVHVRRRQSQVGSIRVHPLCAA